MDGRQFDELLKTLAAQTSRRGALRGLVAVALGGGLGLGRLTHADAAQCEPGRKCKAETPKAGRCAGTGLVCEDGRFACPTVANATASFVGGTCQYTCTARPNATASFTNGACQYACQTGFANCDGDILSNGCEVDPNTDALNCGGCAGAGGTACDEFFDCCKGTCTDPSTYFFDPTNCGFCGNACADGETCCNGSCCASNGCCNNSFCIDVQSDPLNCGGCNNECFAGDVCINGSCTATCGGAVCNDCYSTCTHCGCFDCTDPNGTGCGQYQEFCCPSGNFDECLGLDPCPEDTQRFITRR